jgi:hypothetical protein
MMGDIFDQLSGAPADPQPDAAEPAPADEVSAADAFTPSQIKDASQDLLKYGLLEASRKPNLYRNAMRHRDSINRVLEPFDLAMKLDEVRGLAYLVVAIPGKQESSDADEWSHPLVRRQRLSLEQSLLVAILRQHFVAHEQQAGVGASEALVALDDLLPIVQLYLGGLGSDAQEQKRLLNLLEHLKGHGVVSEVDANDQVSIRPIISHVANPENLQNLLLALRAETSGRESLPDNDLGDD